MRFKPNGRKIKVAISALVLLSGPSCFLLSKNEQISDNKKLTEFSIAAKPDFGNDGCKTMMDDYCSHLYSPEASGNLIIDRRRPIQILRGETSNHLRQVYVKYAQAKIKNRNKLPADFVDRLNHGSYFDKLESFIHRAPISKMTIGDRLHTERLESELAFIWDSALDQTIVLRMSHKYPGYHQIPERQLPIEYSIEEKRVRRALISEISKILWREDVNWHRVEEEFRSLKVSFSDFIDRLDASESLRMSWKKKINSIELVLPGALPAIADEECSTTNVNAFYYKNRNIITVCAGDFNSEDIVLTLAHEMSHALGIDRDFIQFMAQTDLNQKIYSLRQNLCGNAEQLNCESWGKFKSSMDDGLKELTNFEPEFPEFNRCLKKNSAYRSMSSADAQRIASSIVTNRISNLASANVFLRIIEKQVPLRSGRLQNNPNYMNPCAYYLWSSNKETIDDELNTLLFFTAEYQCSEGPKNDRLKASIEVAKKMSIDVVKAVVKQEGEFSGRPEVISEGLGSPPFERFADVVGSYAFAEYLKRFREVTERRTKFLASSSWLCAEPSLETHFPELSKIEQQYSMEPHAQKDLRKMEILTPPVREVLSCRADFDFEECQLPQKSSKVLGGDEPELESSGHQKSAK
jgi:hypothetical protein